MSATEIRDEIDIRLLGRFSVDVRGRRVRHLESRRVRELLAFLVINRDRMIGRDVIADTLWPTSRGGARKNLRQVLWQLHSTLDRASGTPLIVADSSSVGIDPGARLRVDVGQLEAAHARLGRAPGPELDAELATFVQGVVSRCTGELLEGCYEDWCLAERERYRAIHLNALDRLIAHAEAIGDLDAGIEYGRTLLRYDRASERTHRRLMMLHHHAGNRSGAVRQFRVCELALREELDVGPGPATLAVYELVRAGRADLADVTPADGDAPVVAAGALAELATLVEQASQLIHRMSALLGRLDDASGHSEDT
ncbi:MAG: hypothetical protein HKN44_07880 [Ilumatobacter sp.]|nr:hypothetical protein [Ilumatobacter sp.]